MADLSSILGGMVQGFKDFGTGLVDMFGTGGAAIGDLFQSGGRSTKNQDDFRKWLYQTDNTQDAAAKGLGTILNGVQTVSDFIPGAGAITRNPLFNGVQGAIGGVADEFKMAGKDYDLGRAAQRAGVGAASGLASAYSNQALGKTGNKLINNGLVRGAAGGALAGGIANAGYTGIEGGSVQDMINAGLYGAQTGALVGGTTGLARELIKPTHKMDVALTDDEKAARIANIDDQIGKLDLNTPEGNARYNELMDARQKYSGNKRLYRGLTQEYDANYPKNKLDTQGYESWTDNPELARQYGENVYYIDVPEGDIKTSYLDENPMSETYGDRNPIYSIDKKAGLNGVSGNEYLLSVGDPYKEGLTYNRLGSKPKTVADLMAESKPKTYYHGSPETDITEFDINRAGKNTRSGEKAIYFTDDPATAEEFSYERTPTDSLFFDKKGRKGGVYEANLDMKNTLDLGNLSDAQIEELWQYASPLGKLDGKEGFIKDMKHLRQVGNDQLIKSKLDLSALANSPYDSFQAKMYPGENDIREYGIFDASKAKITKSPKTVADLMLSPEQKEYFKDSVIRDENGNLKPMYHGTRGDFTVFGDDKPYDGSNSHASVGHWFTPTEEGAKNFANSIWYGDGDPKAMKTYLNMKNPKIYETVDNSAAIEPLAKRLQELEAKSLTSGKLSDTQLYYDDIYKASMVQNMVNQGNEDMAVKWLSDKGYSKENAANLVDEIADIKRLANEKANLQNEISELKYGDAYQRFKTDLYKVDGQTADDANAGGVGMALNDKNSIKKYVDNLKNEGYDGIIIKGTRYDADVMGGPNDQYVVFDSNQIKDVNNLRPTADADIMMAKASTNITGKKTPTNVAELMDDKYKRIGSADVAPINPETLPDSLRMANEYINEGYIKDIEKTMGKPYSKMTDNDFLEYSLRNKKPEDRELFKQIINDMVKDGSTTYEKYAKSAAGNKYLRNLADTKLTDMDSDSLMRYLINNKNKLTDNFTKAADAELSDRLGIGRSNTLMMDNSIGTENAYGVYNPTNSTMSLNTRALGEGDAKTNVAGHERLHSFQTEARIKRYSPEVVDAYKNLRKELRAANAFKNKQEIKDYWGEDIGYYHNNDEQEARMFQQYLEKKGFTDRAPKSSNKVYHEKNVREFDNSKITPAFDKFLDKLRALSKKGVALPALTALFGGGAIAGALTSGKDDKKKKSEVK